MTVSVSFAARAGSIGARLFHDCCRVVLRGEKRRASSIGFVIMSDADIHALNGRFLGHDYPTDVITFPLSDGDLVEAEIYISVDTARRQAAEYRVSLRNELARLAVHGILHACGYDDADDAQRAHMRGLEDRYLGALFGKRTGA